MTTGTEKFVAKSKRLVGVTDFVDRIVGYLNGRIDALAEFTFSAPATFGEIRLVNSGANKYQFLYVSPNITGQLTDGDGHMIRVSNAELKANVPFPNVGATMYYVGVHYCSLPSGVRTNPRTGRQEYVGQKDEIGVTGWPFQIMDNGDGTYTYDVRNLLPDVGDDYTGRTARLYLLNIAPDVANIAEAMVDVVMDTATSFTTDQLLGQSVLSLVETDYLVTILGPSTSETQSAVSTNGYAYIGSILGSGGVPAVFDYTGQPIVETTSWTDMLINGMKNDLFPEVDNTYELGTATKRWAKIYAYAWDVDGNILPSTDDTYNLGGAFNRWSHIYTDDISCNSLFAESGGTYKRIGYASGYWADAFIDNVEAKVIDIGQNAGEGIEGDLKPITDSLYHLGSATYRWGDLWITGNVHANRFYGGESGAANVCAMNWVPLATGTYDLGAPTFYWKDVYAQKLYLLTSAGNGVAASLYPAASNSLDLGSATYYWRRLYVDQMFYKTAATTFDNLNDLELIEAYTPTGQFIDKVKGGTLRSVQTADQSTLPWPVIGDIDPSTGEAFIDAGDSVCFLLGAIKQMYQLHKGEVAGMKETIAKLEAMVKDIQDVRA